MAQFVMAVHFWHTHCYMLKAEDLGMKVAIPRFNGRVSPRFDHAPDFLILTLDDNGEAERKIVSTAGWGPWRRIRMLEEEGVDALICGGIENFWAYGLERRGIRIYPWVTGDIGDVITLLQKGRMQGMMMVLPHAHCKRLRFHGGRWGCGRK